MLIRAWRAASVLILAGCLASPTTTVAAAPIPKSTTAVSTATLSSAPTVKSKVRRRARRAPPGGCYARNAIVVDPSTDEVLYEKNAGASVPIASLTKLMTALVFLDQKPELNRDAMVARVEWTGAGHTQLRVGEYASLDELLHMSLMVSDNCATRVIARESGLQPDDFLAAMNRKALELGMTHTRFVEFTGLDERNVSTAADIARLLEAAASTPKIHEITTTRTYEFWTRRQTHFIGNTNRLLYGKYEVVGGKTGFINEAGYCFATWVRTGGRDLITVVLGAPTNATRFADAIRLIQRTTTTSFTQTQP